MGGFAPIAIQAGMQVAQMQAQRQQAKAAAEAQGKQTAMQGELLWQQQQQHAKRQRDLLKRQLATARASLAAGGGGFAGGSGQALMEGLVRQTEEDIGDGAQATALRHRLQFGDGERDKPDRLQQGIAAAQQGYALLRPFVGR